MCHYWICVRLCPGIIRPHRGVGPWTDFKILLVPTKHRGFTYFTVSPQTSRKKHQQKTIVKFFRSAFCASFVLVTHLRHVVNFWTDAEERILLLIDFCFCLSRWDPICLFVYFCFVFIVRFRNLCQKKWLLPKINLICQSKLQKTSTISKVRFFVILT